MSTYLGCFPKHSPFVEEQTKWLQEVGQLLVPSVTSQSVGSHPLKHQALSFHIPLLSTNGRIGFHTKW